MVRDILRELVIPNETRFLKDVRAFAKETLAGSDLPKGVAYRIVLAVDEAVTNVIEHGYGAGERGMIRISMSAKGGRLEVVVRDHGRHFDPTSVEEVDLERHVREGRRKGLGLFLIRKIMDELRYSFERGLGNRLTMVKFYVPGSSTARSG